MTQNRTHISAESGDKQSNTTLLTLTDPRNLQKKGWAPVLDWLSLRVPYSYAGDVVAWEFHSGIGQVFLYVHRELRIDSESKSWGSVLDQSFIYAGFALTFCSCRHNIVLLQRC